MGNVRQWFRPNQSGVLPGFTFTVDTTNTSTGSSASNQFKLPFANVGVYDCEVFRSDGSSDVITAYNQTEVLHTFPSPGVYTIRIIGDFPGWRFGSAGNGNDHQKILDISQFDGFTPPNETSPTLGVFRDCINLQISATDAPYLSGITAMVGFFRGCTALNSNIGHWDLSNITRAEELFYLCTNFNNGGSDSIKDWDVSNVQFFNSIFSNSRFNQPLTNWDTSAALDMRTMFRNNSVFNQPLNHFTLTNVTTILEIFLNTSAFNQPLNSWNVGNCTNFTRTFQGATAFDQNVGSWNVSKASSLTGFMSGKTPSTFSATNLDAIYNGWSPLTFVNTGLSYSFGTAKYTAAGSAGKAVLQAPPNNHTIIDGGI